eukprot:TRINITY_DN19724_c0_g1_i1.p1 TRINITY_DN19724_c0_g1~~TRINITY_DN19724_c0_g1_i1.p1  ORF type:complete len:399 (+),score=126.79 TRINITY_DN19724_c0_g1_i1:53-1249(+)
MPASTSAISWGTPTFKKDTFALEAHDGSLFEVPYKAIENQTFTARSGDVILELGTTEGCCEMRLNMRDGADVEGGIEGKNNVEGIVQALKARAKQGSEADLGKLVVKFTELNMLAPRGIFTAELYKKHLKLTGRATKSAKTTLEWVIPMETISGIYQLDDARSKGENKWVCVSMSKPIKSGNQQYSCIVFAVPDIIQETVVDLSPLSDEQKNRETREGQPMISEKMNEPLTETIPKCLKAISGAKVVSSIPDVGPFQCSDRSGKEGFIYCLQRSFLFAPNPAIPIRHEIISKVVFTDVHTGGNTVGVTFKMSSGQATLNFQGLDRNDLPALSQYTKSKNIAVEGLEKVEDEAPSDLSSLDMSSGEEVVNDEPDSDDGKKSKKRKTEGDKKSKKAKREA